MFAEVETSVVKTRMKETFPSFGVECRRFRPCVSIVNYAHYIERYGSFTEETGSVGAAGGVFSV
jgi:hypothetical protein